MGEAAGLATAGASWQPYGAAPEPRQERSSSTHAPSLGAQGWREGSVILTAVITRTARAATGGRRGTKLGRLSTRLLAREARPHVDGTKRRKNCSYFGECNTVEAARTSATRAPIATRATTATHRVARWQPLPPTMDVAPVAVAIDVAPAADRAGTWCHAAPLTS